MLLRAGADIDALTPYGYSPYWMAASRDRPTARVLEAAGAETELPPIGTARFSRRHWIPVIATVLSPLAAVVGIFLALDPLPEWWDRLTAVVFALVPGLILLRLFRPILFWSGGVPREQTGSLLTLRRAWGGRLVVDLERVRYADRVPPRATTPSSSAAPAWSWSSTRAPGGG